MLLIFTLTPCAQATSLPPSVLAALKQAHIPLADVGVEVRGLNAHKPLISIHAAQPMNPASTMKLLTTYAGP
ncbi:MAG: D-alanyl-D-alanine carboxypeptidase [Nitrosomonadales bacterium]